MRPPATNLRLGPGHRLIGWMLAGLVLLGGSTQVNRLSGAGQVVGRVGDVTVTATSLRPEPSGSLGGVVHLSTSGTASDQLDVALAAGGTAVSVYHRQVSVGEIPDLASCGGLVPSPGVINHWLHYGPLLVPGRAYGTAPPASATLRLPGASVSVERSVQVTLYFAHAGQLTLDLPVHRD